jgi:hypothetical protein
VLVAQPVAVFAQLVEALQQCVAEPLATVVCVEQLVASLEKQHAQLSVVLKQQPVVAPAVVVERPSVVAA